MLFLGRENSLSALSYDRQGAFGRLFGMELVINSNQIMINFDFFSHFSFLQLRMEFSSSSLRDVGIKKYFRLGPLSFSKYKIFTTITGWNIFKK